MKKKFEEIILGLVGADGRVSPLSGIEIAEQFRPEEISAEATLRNLNAAFLIALCGESHPLYTKASGYMRQLNEHTLWKVHADFYSQGIFLVVSEIESRYSKDMSFREALDSLSSWISDSVKTRHQTEIPDRVWQVFFPEGVSLLERKSFNVESLRENRSVKIRSLNPVPIRDPAREILFSSNMLLTIPPPSVRAGELNLPQSLKDQLDNIRREQQTYWYDHPVQMGVDPSQNEALYGLRGLDRAVEFEKRRGTVDRDMVVSCVLSVSVTHTGLQGVAKSYLKDTLKNAKDIRHINVYAFDESDTSRLIDEVLAPAADYYLDIDASSSLHEIFGVDGEYGRHYSFLKAVSALWQVFFDPGVRATFKIDLDQVFPQEKLVEETGASALEHFKTPLWGAQGEDQQGNPVVLGMIAGALVNQKDIDSSLFTPDVTFPETELKGDEWVFHSRLTQALSTEAEMMTRYENGILDGQGRCIQRFHVTGGTCGILLESLRKYRPFTPGFIGRAEDQAYLLSVLFGGMGGDLRYVHKDGLIMRHDKESFAAQAIRASSTGKLIGDYIRLLMFSYYSEALPWPIERIKKCIDPFTGCFVSYVPMTLVYLRLALEGAYFFKEGMPKEGFELLRMGGARLLKVLRGLNSNPDSLRDRFQAEKEAWNIYYDTLDMVEAALNRAEPFAIGLRERAVKIIKDCKVTV